MMREKYVMALDQGTTSARCILYDRQGRQVSVAQKEFRQIYPREGWVEHDPMDIWSTQMGVAQEAMLKVDAHLRGYRFDRDNEPARDHSSVGQGDGRTGV